MGLLPDTARVGGDGAAKENLNRPPAPGGVTDTVGRAILPSSDGGGEVMAFAVVMRVKLPEGDGPEEGLRMLREQVVPHARSQAGFQSGKWMNHHGDGLGIVVFDSEEHAAAAKDMLKPPPGGPELVSVDVYEVGAEA